MKARNHSSNQSHSRELRKQKWLSRFNHFSNSAHAAFWIISCIAVTYYTNFYSTIWQHPNINSPFFAITLACSGAFLTLISYAAFFTPKHEEIEVIAPNLIPTATIVALVTFVTANLAFWEIWGWMTPGLLITLVFGHLIAGSLLPKSWVGSVIFIFMVTLPVFLPHWVPQQGELQLVG